MADNGLSWWCQLNWRCTEATPGYRYFNDHGGPPAVFAVGAAVDLTALWVVNRYVAPKHPRMVRLGLYAAAVYRGYYAIKNVRVGLEDRRLSQSRF
jgi:hypothetical protein